ncbi:MAG TPA: Arc family DNA-binding protein [Burkholderiaceae bacterium]|nr:Arc family DNA-binding protein [Burkholderiaceae bacterium]
MAVNLSIKGVPEHVAARLRARAERNRRSLQKELLAIVERAAHESDVHAAASLVNGNASGRGTDSGSGQPAATPVTPEVVTRPGSLTVEEIAARLRALYPEPVADLPRSVDIIRQARDSR